MGTKFEFGEKVFIRSSRETCWATYKGPAEVGEKEMASVVIGDEIWGGVGAVPCPGQFAVVPLNTLEPIAEVAFHVGDIVSSAVGNTSSKFRVTGFEREGNRVVCVSINKSVNDKDRMRYAYKVNEVNNLTTSPIKMVPGRRYYFMGKGMSTEIMCYLTYDPFTLEMKLIALEGQMSLGAVVFIFNAKYVPNCILTRKHLDMWGITLMRNVGTPED